MPRKAVTLEDLRAADLEAAGRFPRPSAPGLGGLGLILEKTIDRPRWGSLTPVNCKTFASTGGDGVYFSFLTQGTVVDGRTPVVMTVTAPGGGNWIVGKDLRDFLCLGCRRGYFALEQLAYDLDSTVKAYIHPSDKPDERDRNGSPDFLPYPGARQVLDFLIQRFGLQPWKRPSRFFRLQEQLGPLLIEPEPPAWALRLLENMWATSRRTQED